MRDAVNMEQIAVMGFLTSNCVTSCLDIINEQLSNFTNITYYTKIFSFKEFHLNLGSNLLNNRN